MSDGPAARWVARAWALLAATSALYFLSDNEADNDLWIHLLSGRLALHDGPPQRDSLSYTAVGLPWIDHEWLTQAAFAALFDHFGPTALWLAKLVMALLTAGLVWVTVARRSRSPWVRGPVMILVLAATARGYAMRPQIVTYLAVAVLLAGLDRLTDAPRRPPAWLLIVVIAAGFALWANAHGGVIVGIGILALFTIAPSPWGGASEVRESDVVPLALRAAMLGTAIVAICLTPYGLSLFSYVAAELRAPHPLTEWQPVRPGDPAHLPFLVMLAVLAVTSPLGRTLRAQPWRAALVAITAILALRQQRHVPLFALCAAAPLADQIDAALAWLRTRTSLRPSPGATAAVAIGLAALSFAQLALLTDRLWQTRGAIVYAAEDYPVGAVRFMRAAGLHGNLALPLDWGGYVLWHTAPAIKVSLDGRFATLYPQRVVEDNFAFFRGDDAPGAARLIDEYPTTLALVPSGVSTILDHRAGWQRMYTDSVATLFGAADQPASGRADAPRGLLPFP